jgi:NDP-sugar pyrophosphorylase family protein
MGIYCYSRVALEAIGENERLDFPDLVLRMLAQGERVLAHDAECFWLDIGRHDDYARAIEAFDRLRPSFLPDEIVTEAAVAGDEVMEFDVEARV